MEFSDLSPAAQTAESHGKDCGKPRYIQISERFVRAIENGTMKPGQRVPSIRNMASELRASRNTVEAAYSVLIGDGYLEARGQAGTFVARPHSWARPADRPCPPAPPPCGDMPPGGTPADAGREDDIIAREDPARQFYAAAQADEVMPLQVGLPAIDLFPRKLWTSLNIAMVKRQSHLLSYPDPQGLPELRRAIASHLNLARGLECLPEQIFMTSGFRGALNLFLNVMSRPLQKVWIEDPCFPPTRSIVQDHALELAPVPVDAEGLRVEEGIALAPDAQLAVLTPAHHSPLGMCLSAPRRQALLDWADANSAFILEDDYDSEFRYDGQRMPALSAHDRNGMTFLAGTFSKTLSPALRTGYLVVPLRFVGRFREASLLNNQASSPVIQATLHAMIEQHHFSRHVHKMRLAYARRRKMLTGAMREILADRFRVELPTSGLNLLARLPRDADDVALARRARAANLGVSPLSPRRIDADCGKGLLLGFANVATPECADRLARALRVSLGS